MMDQCRQARLARVALRLNVIVTVVALALLAGSAMAAVTGSIDGRWITVEVDGAGSAQHARIVSAASGAVTVAALLIFRSALAAIAAGQPFGRPVRRRLRLTAGLMAVASLISILLPTLLDWLLPSPGTALSLSLRGSDLIWLVSALTLYTMSVVIELAAEFEVDSRAIV